MKIIQNLNIPEVSISVGDSAVGSVLTNVAGIATFGALVTVYSPVIAATTANVTIANPGTATFDGIVLTAGQRLLVWKQTSAPENGIYIWHTAITPLTRATDMDASAEVRTGDTVYNTSGTLYGGKQFNVIAASPFTIGSSNLNFALVGNGTLTSAHLFVGNSSNVATDVAASGDISLSNTGAFTVLAAPASGITGATLASNVLASSLTSVGSLSSLTVSGTSKFTGTSRFDAAVAMGNHAVDTTSDLLIQSNGTMTGASQASLQITSLAAATATTDAGQLYLNGRTVNSVFTCTNYYVARIDAGSYGASSVITTLTGLYIANQTKATTNYAIQTNKGMVKFGDVLTKAASTFSNADYTVPTVAAGTASVNYVGQTGTMSASRAVTLPAASNFPRGTFLTIADESGSVGVTNTIVITRAGSDTIDGGTTFTINFAYGAATLVSNGSNAWTVINKVLA